jgi:hypothetical protein
MIESGRTQAVVWRRPPLRRPRSAIEPIAPAGTLMPARRALASRHCWSDGFYGTSSL